MLHCPYCHGWEVRDAPLAVLGASPDRVRLALHLTRLSGDVALCTNADGPLDPGARRELERNGVAIYEAAIVRVEDEGDDVVRLVFGEGPPLARRALFVHSQTRQRSALAAGLGCALLEDGSVQVDDCGHTSMPGVFAAGDVARRPSMPRSAAAAGPDVPGATSCRAWLSTFLSSIIACAMESANPAPAGFPGRGPRPPMAICVAPRRSNWRVAVD